jgi:O-antigen ligase
LEARVAVILRRFIFIGCCIFAISLPFDFSLKNINLSLPGIKSLLVLEIAGLIFLWELVIVYERRIFIKTTELVFAISAFFIFHLYSSIFPSDILVWSLKYTLRFFSLGLIFFVLVNFIQGKKQLEHLLNCLFVGAGIAAIFVFIQYFRPYTLSSIQAFFDDAVVSPNRMRGLFGWHTNMAVYLGSFIPLVLSCLIYKPAKFKSKEKLFYTLLIIILMSALILSRSRGWILGLLCGLSTLWLLHLINRKEYPVIWVTIIILAIGFLVSFWTGLNRFVIGDLEPSESGRLALFKEALKVIKAHPIRGVGADMFCWVSPFQGSRTHNIFLETLANLGALGLLFLVWFFYKSFAAIGKGILKDAGFRNSYIQVGVICSLASFLGHCQVDYFWAVSEVIGLFWVLVGIGVCASLAES